MKFWRDEHQALLDAIRADDTVPVMIARITEGAIDVPTNELARWRAWAVALRTDAAGAHVLAHRGVPEDWPAIWEANEAEFGPELDIHNALLLTQLFGRLADAGAWDVARLTWRRALRAWSRLDSTPYLAERARHAAGDTEIDPIPIARGLLLPHVDELLAQLKRGLQLGAESFVSVREELAAFAWGCLDDAAAMIGIEGECDLLSTTRQKAMEAKAFVVASATTRFRRAVDAIDWAEGDAGSITAPFRWLVEVCGVVEFRENLSTTALKAMIDGAWTLRKIDRDDEDVFTDLVFVAEPFAMDVIGRLEAGAAFGQGSRAADWLVFLGESSTDGARRRELFEQALELSMGHRNASLLLSYEILVDVDRLLLQLTTSMPFVTRVPVVGDSVVDTVYRAWELCDEVEAVYPYNSKLDDYRERVRTEADRLGVTLPGETDG